MRCRAALLLTVLTVLPGGCVAAIAPIVAGGLMAKTQMANSNGEQSDPVREAELAALARTAGDEAVSASELPALIADQAPVVAPAVQSTSPAAPRPAAVLAPAASAPGSAGRWAAYGALHDYTVEHAHHTQTLRQSALLVDPGTVQPNRKGCISPRSAIVIDLDPQGGFFPLDGSSSADPAMISALSSLRQEAVSIYWTTSLLPDRVNQVKQRLAEAGLDPDSKDTVLPARYPGERKQGRRQSVGESNCLLAIAGDERADFDDLYEYLRDPGFAAPLESMIGNGWFLIPTPLN